MKISRYNLILALVNDYLIDSPAAIKTFLPKYYSSKSTFLSLTKELKEIIFGLSLGDLYIEQSSPTSNSRLSFSYKGASQDYVEYLLSKFSPWCTSSTAVKTRTRTNKTRFVKGARRPIVDSTVSAEFKTRF